MAKWNYDEIHDNIRAPLWNAARMQSSEENRSIDQLFKFIEQWYHNYKVVCEEFDLYSEVPVNGIIPIDCYDNGLESYEYGFRKVDFFSVNFFEKILQKTCIFEKIVQPQYDYFSSFNRNEIGYNCVPSPASKLCIMSERFTLSRESNNTNRVWVLDTKMANNQSPQQGLVLSLIQTLMGNYVPLSLYKRNKNFRNFIDKFSDTTQFDFRFEGSDKEMSTERGSIVSYPDWTIFRYVTRTVDGAELVTIHHHRFESNNLMFSYKHLDELFGKDRKEMLTKEDLQLYSICNEGRKPFIFDWEFTI